MKIKFFIIAVLSLAVIALAGCGGGGDTPASNPADTPAVPAGGTNPAPAPTPAPTKGVVKLSTSGAAAVMAGIDVTVDLPDGVILNADPATGEVLAGTITISGVAATGGNNVAAAKFTPASGGVPATLHIAIINVSGFGLGEFATVHFDLATGASLPALSAFSVSTFSAKGLTGAALGGITCAPTSVVGI